MQDLEKPGTKKPQRCKAMRLRKRGWRPASVLGDAAGTIRRSKMAAVASMTSPGCAARPREGVEPANHSCMVKLAGMLTERFNIPPWKQKKFS